MRSLLLILLVVCTSCGDSGAGYSPMQPLDAAVVPADAGAIPADSPCVLPGQPMLNVAYGGDPLQVFDLYPGGGDSCTFLIMVHGGGWTGGDKREFSAASQWLAEKGYPVANMNYPLPARFPEDPANILRVMTALQRDHGARRFVLYGHSAGAHLAMLAALAQNSEPPPFGNVAVYPSSPIVAAIGSSGSYDYHLLQAGLGKFTAFAATDLEGANVVNHADAADVPCLLIAASQDTLAPWQSSRDLAAKIPDRCEYHLVEGVGHNDVKLLNQTLNVTVAQFIEAFLGRVAPL